MKYLSILLLIFPLHLFGQTLTIPIGELHFNIDEELKMVVSHIENIENYKDLGSYKEVFIELNRRKFIVEGNIDSISYTSKYRVIDEVSSESYAFYFTELPLMSIDAQVEIPDDPKVPSIIKYADTSKSKEYIAGVELRGGFSQTFPKKTYDLEFWEDEVSQKSTDAQFGDMRADDDWILDALYNEPLRIRSHYAHKLWLAVHELYYADEEPEAKSGADVMYVELFLNGRYNGLYNLSEQVDRKQLKLKKIKNDEIRGELYKGSDWGATTFTELPPYDNSIDLWGGHEVKYPDEDDTIQWKELYDFTDFVINSSDETFKNQIWNDFEKSNFMDYFIFLNLLRATDNTGKNIYLGQYNSDEPYFYTPWDLDGCFGTNWEGLNDNVTEDIIQNYMMERVIDLDPDRYKRMVAERWF